MSDEGRVLIPPAGGKEVGGVEPGKEDCQTATSLPPPWESALYRGRPALEKVMGGWSSSSK